MKDKRKRKTYIYECKTIETLKWQNNKYWTNGHGNG